MVRTPRELESVLKVCRSEAKAAFGDDSLYLEKWLDENRHVEVQIAVDRTVMASTWASATARSSGGIRRSSRSPEPRSPPRRAPTSASGDPRGRRGRVRERRHARVPGRRARRLLFHRDQLPDPGRASRHRGGHRPRPRRDADAHRGRRAARHHPGRHRLRRPRDRVPDQRRGPGARLPAGAGSVERYLAPGGPGVRMDSHLYTGYEVPPFYDSLLGKLIVWGPDRATAIARGRVALEELVIDGITTNVDIHQALLASETFLEGRMTTNLLDRVGSAAFLGGGRPGVGTRSCRPAHATPQPPALIAQTDQSPRPGVARDRDRPHDRRDRTPHPASPSVPARRPDRRVRRRTRSGSSGEGRDGDEWFFAGPLPRTAGHAGRPPGRGAGPDDGGLRRQARGLRRPDRPVRRHRRGPVQADRRPGRHAPPRGHDGEARVAVRQGPGRRKRRRRGGLRGAPEFHHPARGALR